MTVVAVTGGRDWKPVSADQLELLRVLAYLGARVLRNGMALGLDMWAAGVVKTYARHIFVEPYYPDWGNHGSKAGPIRNGQMLRGEHGELRLGNADVLLSYPGGTGTEDCTRQAHGLGVTVVTVVEGAADWTEIKGFLEKRR